MDHSFLRWIRGRRLDSHSLFSVIRTYLILFFNVFELFRIFGWGFLHVHTNVNIRANQDILQINTCFFIGWNFIFTYYPWALKTAPWHYGQFWRLHYNGPLRIFGLLLWLSPVWFIFGFQGRICCRRRLWAPYLQVTFSALSSILSFFGMSPGRWCRILSQRL